MIYNASDVEADLKALRKGWGIEAPDIESKIGEALRATAGAQDEHGSARVRKLVTDFLNARIERLPGELRLACRAAFALDPGIRQRLLKERILVVSERIERDARTVQRRMDAGIARIAEAAVRSPDPDHPVPDRTRPPWRTVELQAIVVLDQPVPEVFELRRIVAERDNLSRVDLALTLSPPPGYRTGVPGDLGLHLLHGGLLRDRVMKSTNRIGFALDLPEPLRYGAEHEFALRVTMPSAPMAPHYVCTPQYPCDLFRLHVRFGPDRLPASVWRLENAPPWEIDDPAADREALPVNGSGEASARFTALEPHLSYGITWSATTA